MGWERRGNNLYYYHKRRQGRRVISEYIGTGECAYLISILDREEKMERQYKFDQQKRFECNVKKINRDIDQISTAINGYLRASLLLSGYHSHKGQWRKARNE